jgi:hypothetical protein
MLASLVLNVTLMVTLKGADVVKPVIVPCIQRALEPPTEELVSDMISRVLPTV